MTRERKIYAGVLGLAVLALGANQFVFGPTPTHAAGAGPLAVRSGAQVNAAHKSEIATPSPAVSAGLAMLQRQMDAVSSRDGLNVADTTDVFCPPASWLKNKPTRQDNSIASFASRHHLVAVLKSSHGGMAVLAGAGRRSLRIGQQVDGFRLIAVGERSATFASPQGHVELPLSIDPPSDAQITASPAR